MSEKAINARRVKRAAQMLLFKRHLKPGAKSWELRRTLGKDFMKILELLDTRLEPLGLEVKTVYEGVESPKTPTKEQLERASFYVTIKDPMKATDLRTSGWRVDNVAALAVAVAFIISKQGKTPRREVEDALRKKFPKWRVDYVLNRFIRRGYLIEDEDKVLYLNWRARAEIDQKMLLKLIIGEETES